MIDVFIIKRTHKSCLVKSFEQFNRVHVRCRLAYASLQTLVFQNVYFSFCFKFLESFLYLLTSVFWTKSYDVFIVFKTSIEYSKCYSKYS